MFRGNKLRQKEVINIRTAQRMGMVSDVEINDQTGNVEAIIVPKRGRIFTGLFGGGEVVIPWENIEVVGRDVILVRVFEFAELNK